MENVPNGVAMSPGVASSIAAPRATIEAPTRGNESRVSEKPVEANSEPIKIHEEIAEQDTVGFAAEIEEAAKTEGVDAAFEKLAMEESSEIEGDVEKDSENLTSETHKDLEVENSPIRQEMELLTQKVEGLSAQNESLIKRVEKAESVSAMAVVTAYELAQILKKMLEEEEVDKKKKETLLAVLAKLMATLLTMILVDEPRDNQGRANKEEIAA